ncbi:MAG: transketolase [Desulfovibrionaceae bacterium]
MKPTIEALRDKASALRRTVLEMCVRNGGHLASSFSCMEILVALYQGGRLNVSPDNPGDPDRDRFILSKGHAETVLYAVLADKGFIPAEWLRSCYRSGDCTLGGHPDHKTPGVEITSGALGHGLGIGAGLAAAAKLDGRAQKTVVLMGDAECTEGSVWEAALFAAQRGLGNLIGIVDRNHIGSLDYTCNYAGLGGFPDKWRAFGWEVMEVDGHDLAALGTALDYAWARRKEQPFMMVANTVKGKGVSFVENEPIWHVKGMCDPDEIRQAQQELGCVCHETD